MEDGKQFTADKAKRIGKQIGIDWQQVDLDEFRKGLAVEMEHGSHDPETDVTHDDPLLTGKISRNMPTTTPGWSKWRWRRNVTGRNTEVDR